MRDQLAGIGGELAALLGGGLVVDEGAVDAPVDLLDCGERVGRAKHLGAVVGERDLDRRGLLAVHVGKAVGMKTPPQAIVRVIKPALGLGELFGERGVPLEQGIELCRQLAREIWNRAAHRVLSFGCVHDSRAAGERERPARARLAGSGPGWSRRPWTGQRRSYGHRTLSPSGPASTTSRPRRPQVQSCSPMTGRPAWRQARIARLPHAWSAFMTAPPTGPRCRSAAAVGSRRAAERGPPG